MATRLQLHRNLLGALTLLLFVPATSHAWEPNRFKIGESNAFVMEPPKSKRNDGPMPWIWYAPTLGTHLPSERDEKWMFDRLHAAGIAIAGIDVGESYGSPQGRLIYQQLYNELTNKRGYSKKPVLLARSRGGLMLYSWAAEHPKSVGAIAAIYPVCNIESYPGVAKAAPAFQLTTEELKSKLDVHNPINRLDGLAKSRVPIFHLQGDSDTVVPHELNSEIVEKWYTELGGPIEIELIKDQGHNLWRGWFESETLTKFMIEKALGKTKAAGATEASENEADETEKADKAPSLNELKKAGAQNSSIRKYKPTVVGNQPPKANLATFQQHIQPVLQKTCVQCHGEDLTEGNIRIDTLDPDLIHGDDVAWWLEVLAVLTKGEMPPPDEAELADKDRARIIEWLTSEIQIASVVQRAEGGHSSFRRLTRYEYKYALQDLLGLPFDFGKNLPPDPNSEDGFQNSSEMLHMSAMQFQTYRESARSGLELATIRGEQPKTVRWSIPMKGEAERIWAKQDNEEKELRKKHKDDPERLKKALEEHHNKTHRKQGGVYATNLRTGRAGRVSWGYGGAKYAWAPLDETTKPEPTETTDLDHVVVIARNNRLTVELGDQIGDRGNFRVRVLASHEPNDDGYIPSLQLEFGWQASNDSRSSIPISQHDWEIDATLDSPTVYEWQVPLSEIYPRNSVKNISKMGDLPSPSEYIKLVNSSVSNANIHIHRVEVAAPVYESWPPASHKQIFIDSKTGNKNDDEPAYAREVIANVMQRTWRRAVTEEELERKLKLFARIRPECDDFQEAIVEVLATVLSSPNFLYVTRDTDEEGPARLNDEELATRLAIFLWSSIPDETLLNLALNGQLSEGPVLREQVERMLRDPRSKRFSRNFVRQWLGLELLDYLDVDRKAYPRFDSTLKDAMQQEPIALFHEMLRNNHSVLDFLHADYTMANERLARHYGLQDVKGNSPQRVALKDTPQLRGGLLTQAGLLAMNSDGKDSHPLKRGVWMLERLLNDPPPPPPPAVPEIDLADPEIAKMTLKERIEDHRNNAACLSCHQKIDPWGIAFENFDAIGNWRTKVNDKPVDAASTLFNGEKLDGMEGLKRYLLKHRQDQFVRAMVHKTATYALGRPLTFADRSSIDQITADVRKQGDGLVTMVQSIVASELFQSR